jgi:hypothetical protein
MGRVRHRAPPVDPSPYASRLHAAPGVGCSIGTPAVKGQSGEGTFGQTFLRTLRWVQAHVLCITFVFVWLPNEDR